MTNRQLKVLDSERISERLFEQERIRKRICGDYRIEDVGGPTQMADRLVESIGQVCPPAGGIQALEYDQTVFRAAALALASNMRSWSRLLRHRGEFKSLLKQYDPVAFAQGVETDCSLVRNVKHCLGGWTARADVNAIVKWANMPALDCVYFNALSELKSGLEAEMHDGEVVPVLAAFLGSPSKKAENRWPRPPTGVESWKAPGMGMVLASEFLRNLHWDGFKPDRHIKRLMGLWLPGVIEAQCGRATDLARGMLFRSSKDVTIGLKISLAGMAVTPDDCTFTKADNLVWALGAYVEKKNRESGEVYWKTVAASRKAEG